jgi:hypothetical protein
VPRIYLGWRGDSWRPGDLLETWHSSGLQDVYDIYTVEHGFIIHILLYILETWRLKIQIYESLFQKIGGHGHPVFSWNG